MSTAAALFLCPPPVDRAPLRARCAACDADQTLSEVARLWLRRLPARRRPMRLSVAFPRLANRLALCWPDPALSTQVLEDLCVDRRGGRRGFAPVVRRELQRLREFNAQQRTERCPETLLQAVGRIVGIG